MYFINFKREGDDGIFIKSDEAFDVAPVTREAFSAWLLSCELGFKTDTPSTVVATEHHDALFNELLSLNATVFLSRTDLSYNFALFQSTEIQHSKCMMLFHGIIYNNGIWYRYAPYYGNECNLKTITRQMKIANV